MEQIKIENGIITRHVGSATLLDGFTEIKGQFNGAIGEPIKYYDKDFNRIPDIELMQKGIKEIPKGYKIEKGELIAMPQVEKIKAKIEEIPKGYKLVDDELVYKTQSEQYKDGELSKEDYAEMKRTERDSKLSQTDKYLLPDFPISAASLDAVKKYRQQLRDLPQQKKWPAVDFPQLPEIKK